MTDVQYQSTLAYAQEQDAKDSLKNFREQFHFPLDSQGNKLIYLCGNSLGLQPKAANEFVNQELKDWANLAVQGHAIAKQPWTPYHELLTQKMATVVGAKPHEVVIMNTLTVNLHFMMVSFYRPTKSRYKIVIESDAFPSDKYAVESQLKFHGFDPKESLVLWQPPEGEDLCRFEDLEQILEDQGDEIALIMIGNSNYYTGQAYPLKKITQLGHSHGCKVGFDLAHGAGNLQLNIHDSGADFAVWCTYKYLNGGPGSLGGCFVHERHANNPDLKRFTGWWGHNKEKRFNMRDDFDAISGAEGWQVSNPSILSMAPIRASLDLFDAAGMDNLRKKAVKLTAYTELLLRELGEDKIRIITPQNPDERGCQLSVLVKNANRTVHDKLTEAGVICDWRHPGVIRIAPAPIYNSFEDVFHFVERLKIILKD